MAKKKQPQLPEWQVDAKTPSSYSACETRAGRKFIIRLTTGADPTLAIEQFAKDNGIKYGIVNTAFMGAFQPTHYYVWAPDTANPDNWHREVEAVCENLSMLTAIGGMIGQRPTKEGGEETFVAMHFCAGASWNNGPIMGHLLKGTRVKGVMQCIITELLDIEVLPPVDVFDGFYAYTYPENFYKNIAKK